MTPKEVAQFTVDPPPPPQYPKTFYTASPHTKKIYRAYVYKYLSDPHPIDAGILSSVATEFDWLEE